MLLPEHKPDTFEKVVRFVCGALIAAPIALYATHEIDGPMTFGWIAGIAGFMLVIGSLAVYFGDRFWLVFARLFTFW